MTERKRLGDFGERIAAHRLESLGMERIDPAGLPFDPALHEAVATTPPASPEQDHTVCRTFQAGYRFKGALLRPARVQVYADPGQA